MTTTAQNANNRVAALFRDQRDRILREWTQSVAESLRGRTTANESKAELTPMFDALVAGMNVAGFDLANPAYDELKAMLAEYSKSRARGGFTPTETAVAVFALRGAVHNAMREAKTGNDEDFAAFSHLIDNLGLATFESFAQTRESIIANQAEQMLELSTPVVKLWEGVVAVPIIGTLDSARTQIVMEELLQALVTTGSAHAIIDITGVPAVDTQVAQHLLKTVMAARLMGAECLISGIRPQIAQTIVALGIEFGDIVTKATLADALRLTLQRSGFEVRKADKRA